MRLTRNELTTKLPLPRKGNKYVVRAASHVWNSVPVLIAVRDMLGLARTSKEVKEMIKQGSLKVNGKKVKDERESIRLFNILEADKTYVLTLLPTKKFALEETKEKTQRLCKVTNKKLLSSGKIQLNMYDGSNVLSKDKIAVEDSVYLDLSGKIKKHVALEKGSDVFIIEGRYTGLYGKVENISGKLVSVKFKDTKAVVPAREVVAQ